MNGAFLYRLNFEEYEKNEIEMDEKIEELSLDTDDEDIKPLDEAYVIRFDTNKVVEEGNRYYLLLIGDSNYDVDYIENLLYGQEPSYARYVELQKTEPRRMTADEFAELFSLRKNFSPREDNEAVELAKAIANRTSPYGVVIRQIF